LSVFVILLFNHVTPTFGFCHVNTNVGCARSGGQKFKKDSFLQLQFVTKTTLKI